MSASPESCLCSLHFMTFPIPKRSTPFPPSPFLFLPSTLHRRRSSEVDVDRLDVGVVCERVRSELSSDTGRLVSSEGDGGREGVVAVDPHGSGLNLVGGVDAAGDVAREDSRGETVLGLGTRRKKRGGGGGESFVRTREWDVETGRTLLASAMPSSSAENLVIAITGPKISSLKMVCSGVTSANTVGSM